MTDKKIKIHLAASSDLAALRSANTELAKITLSVGRTNAATRQAALASAREWATLGGSADRAGSRVVLTAFQFTRPRGARREDARNRRSIHDVSIHAPARGATYHQRYSA